MDVFYVLADVRGAALQLLRPVDGHLASLRCRGDLVARERNKRCLILSEEVLFIGAVGYYCRTPQKLELWGFSASHTPTPTQQDRGALRLFLVLDVQSC